MKESSDKSLLLFISFFVILCGGYIVFNQLGEHKGISLDGNNASKYFSEDGLPRFNFSRNNKSNFSTHNSGSSALIGTLKNTEVKLDVNQTEISNIQVDFPNINSSAIRKKVQVNSDNNSVSNSNNINYNSSSTSHSEYNYNAQRQIQEQANTYSNNKLSSINSVAPTSLNTYTAKSTDGGSNLSTQSYLADNSASLLINNFGDVGNNNGRMLLDGESNPGDPGTLVPVGDGTWLLLLFVLAYTIWVFKFKK